MEFNALSRGHVLLQGRSDLWLLAARAVPGRTAQFHIVHGIQTWRLCCSVTAVTGSRVMHSVPVYENMLF